MHNFTPFGYAIRKTRTIRKGRPFMRTTSRTLLLALAVSAAVAAVALLIIFRFVMPKREINAPTPAYTIGVWEGKVAVFEGEDDFPMQVFEEAVNGLPPQQQKEIENGIPVENADELYLLLEDYTS